MYISNKTAMVSATKQKDGGKFSDSEHAEKAVFMVKVSYEVLEWHYQCVAYKIQCREDGV